MVYLYLLALTVFSTLTFATRRYGCLLLFSGSCEVEHNYNWYAITLGMIIERTREQISI